MPDSYITCELEKILTGETLPGSIYVYVDLRFITLRAKGDTLDRDAYDRLSMKGVKFLFIMEKDREAFQAWSSVREPMPPPVTEEDKELREARDDAHRAAMDIFHEGHPNKIVAQTLAVSKKLVTEIMKNPLAVRPLAQLQSFSQGTVDHSVNVAVLSVYLGMQMGYSHSMILQHLASGALLHDIGKTQVPVDDDDTPEQVSVKMRSHADLGTIFLESIPDVPNEVKMIVAQHHECQDGSGYPKKLRGNQVYDLARVVAIANQFDELVSSGKGKLVDRQRAAVTKLDQELSAKFDPQKLDKAIKILKLGL